jgi:hypothetical protein
MEQETFDETHSCGLERRLCVMNFGGQIKLWHFFIIGHTAEKIAHVYNDKIHVGPLHGALSAN